MDLEAKVLNDLTEKIDKINEMAIVYPQISNDARC
jgi:hypothetical protein